MLRVVCVSLTVFFANVGCSGPAPAGEGEGETAEGEGEGEDRTDALAPVCSDVAPCASGQECIALRDPPTRCYERCTNADCSTLLGDDGVCFVFNNNQTGEQTPPMCVVRAPLLDRCGDEKNTVCADDGARCARIGFDNPESSDIDESTLRFCLLKCNATTPCPGGLVCSDGVAIRTPGDPDVFGACTAPVELGARCGIDLDHFFTCGPLQACSPSAFEGVCVDASP